MIKHGKSSQTELHRFTFLKFQGYVLASQNWPTRNPKRTQRFLLRPDAFFVYSGMALR